MPEPNEVGPKCRPREGGAGGETGEGLQWRGLGRILKGAQGFEGRAVRPDCQGADGRSKRCALVAAGRGSREHWGHVVLVKLTRQDAPSPALFCSTAAAMSRSFDW